jgi:glyoxylate reductase
VAEVAVTYPLPGGALDRLAARHEVRVYRGGGCLAGEALAAFTGEADALIPLVSDGVDAVVFARCRRLRVVANVGVGVNNIDLGAARSSGVTVTNTPDVLTEATADLTWALILAVVRRVVEGDRLLRSGGFTGWRPDFFLSGDMQGAVLGIVGMGRIGRAVARRAAPFGVRVHYTSPRPVAEAPTGARYFADLDAMLPEVGILSLHCPLTASTRGLIDRRRLRLLPPGAVLINTSRGEVVDEGAVVEALSEGHLGGAGLDVFEREPEVHPELLGRCDVVLLPHIGSATQGTRAAMADLAVDNALAVLDGRPPLTPVAAPPG